MKYYTKKNERFNTRELGSYGCYPIYEKYTEMLVAILECYSCDVDGFLKQADKIGNIDWFPFYTVKAGK